MEVEEPLSPAGRLFVRPEMNQIINFVIGAKNPIDIDAVRTEINSSILLQHPRFYSLLVIDRHGREHWRKTRVEADRHLIIRREPVVEAGAATDEEAANAYLADLAVSSPLSLDKPLWEIHLLMAHNCTVFRVHHALGDGISLMSLFLSLCRRADDPNLRPTIGSFSPSRLMRRRFNLCTILWILWYTFVYVIEFVLRSLWVRDEETAVSGGDGVELWPRKLATASFRLEDMKLVKKAVANATINDVLFGVISSGLSKYLEIRSPKALSDGLQLTGVAMVNVRPQPGLQEFSKLKKQWGNKFSMLLLPVYYHEGGSDPLRFVKRAKAMIDRKKLSLEALITYKLGDWVMSYFGSKVAGLLNYRILCNTTFTISNVVGPLEEITIVGNPITYMRVNSSSLPHAITMHMISYAGRADMQILVAKDIIPDPKILAKCFEDALLEMKEATEAITKT